MKAILDFIFKIYEQNYEKILSTISKDNDRLVKIKYKIVGIEDYNEISNYSF